MSVEAVGPCQPLGEHDLQMGSAAGPVPLHVDPLPRLLDGAEFDRLAAGLVQRARALEAFLADPAVAVREGVVPAELVDGCLYREPGPAPPALHVGVYGPDVVRGADGELVVLEDNVRTPTLMGYAAGLRALMPAPPSVRGHDDLVPALARVLRAAAPDLDEPVVAVLGDERGSNVRWEPQCLADAMGVPLVDLSQLTARGDRLLLPDGRPVDVLWRRTSEERLLGDDGRPNRLGTALLPGLSSGRLRVVNAFGTGLADDKRTYPHVEDLVRLHLGEEPLVRSVRCTDAADVLDRLDELVLKPRYGCGGWGVSVPGSPDRERAVAAVRADPDGWVAQEVVALSTCPTLVDGEVVERHVDLRPCVLLDGVGATVLAGGVTRVALGAGDLVVNCSQGGGVKDTWVVDDLAADQRSSANSSPGP